MLKTSQGVGPSEGCKSGRRSAATAVLFLLAFMIAWTLRTTWLYRIDESIDSPTGRTLYSTLVKFALWALPAIGFGLYFRRASPSQYLGLVPSPGRKEWRWSLLITAAYLAAIAVVELCVGHKSLRTPATLFSGTVFLQLLASPLIEEILFRGLLLKEAAVLMRTTAANLTISAIFVGVHMPFWLSQAPPMRILVTNASGVFLFSLVAGWLYLRTRSVWPPAVAHIGNNALASLLVAAP